VSTQFLTGDNNGGFSTVTLKASVPKRPQVRAPKFGEWLQLQRGDRSLEQIAGKVRRHVELAGLKVNRSLVQKIEQGRVPNWPLLAAFSRVYEVPITETVIRLIGAMEFPGADDLLRTDKSDTSDANSAQAHRADTDRRPRGDGERELLTEQLHDRTIYAETDVAPTAEAFERVVGDLAALVKQLPRRSAAVARSGRSASAARDRRDRAKHGRKHPKKPARE
jgi:hypothetical protein